MLTMDPNIRFVDLDLDEIVRIAQERNVPLRRQLTDHQGVLRFEAYLLSSVPRTTPPRPGKPEMTRPSSLAEQLDGYLSGKQPADLFDSYTSHFEITGAPILGTGSRRSWTLRLLKDPRVEAVRNADGYFEQVETDWGMSPVFRRVVPAVGGSR